MWIEIIRNYFFDHNKSSINGLVIFPYLMYQNDVQYCFIAVFEIYIYFKYQNIYINHYNDIILLKISIA